MKHILFLFFFIPLFSGAQNFPISPNKFDENGKRHGHWTILYDTAWKEVHSTDSAKYYRLIRFENGKTSGKVRDFYKNGIKQWDGYLLSLNPDVFDGEGNFYYENGKVHFSRTYVNGKWNGINLEYSILGKVLKRELYKDGLAEGLCSYFYEDGSKNSEFLFKQNSANGPANFYYPSGKLKSKFFLKNNVRDGLKEDYDEDGKIKTRLYYVNGQLQNDYADFFPDGSTKERGKYKNDKQEGFWIESYLSGKTKNKGNFKEGLQEGVWFYYYENGNLKRTGTYRSDNYEGEWRYYHENGKLQATIPYKNGKAEGECHYYYEDEKLKSVGQRKKDLAEGEWLTYFSNSKISDLSTYARDTLNGPSEEYYESGVKKNNGLYSKGVKHGYFKFYFVNGNLKSEGDFIYGKREGLWKFFNEDGSKDATENYKIGELDGEANYYYPEGPLKQQAFYKAGKLEGVALKYYLSGKLRKREEFANNVTHGKFETFYEDGAKEKVSFFKEGKEHGTYFQYYPNGKLKSREDYVDGVLNGFSESYYSNGQIEWTGNSKNGKADGRVTSYYKNGKLMFEKDLREGRIEGMSVIYDSTTGKVLGKGLFVKNLQHGEWLTYPKGKKHVEYFCMGKKETRQFVIDSINRISARNDYAGAIRAVKWLEVVTKRDAKTRIERALPLSIHGSVYADAGDYEKSFYYYKKYLDVAEKYVSGTVTHKTALHNVGYALQYLKRYTEALNYLDQAVERARKFDVGGYWASVVVKSYCLYDAGRAEEAEKLLDAELEKANRRYADSVVAWEFRRDVAGYFYSRPSNYSKAKAIYLSLTKDIHRYQQPDHEIAYRSFYMLGNIFQRELQNEMAGNYYDSAIAYAERNKLTGYARYDESLLGLYDAIKGTDSLQSAKRNEVITKIKNVVASNVDHDLLSRLYRTLQVYEYDYGTYNQSLVYAKNALDETLKAGKENSLLHANILQTEAWCHYNTNKRDYSIGESLFEKALEIRRKLYGEKSDNYYLSKMILGTFYKNISRFQKAEQTLKEVMPFLKADNNLEDIANVERYLGEVNYDQGKYSQALAHFEAALPFYKTNHKEFPYYYLNVLKLLSNTYRGLNRYELAMSFAESAYNYAVELKGKLNSTALSRLEALAGVHQYFSVYSEAQKYFQQHADGCKSLYGTGSDEYLYSLVNLAAVYRQKGERQKSVDLMLPYFKKLDAQPSSPVYLSVVTELAEATSGGADEESYRKKKLKCYKDLYGEDNYYYAKYLNDLGTIYKDQYRMEEGESALTKALAIVLKTEYGKTFYARDFYSSLANLKSSLDKNKEAEELFLESVAITAKDTLNSPVTYELSCQDLADFYSKMGRYADAEKVIRKTIALVQRKEGKTFYYHRMRWNLAMAYLSQEKYKEAYDLSSDVAKTVEEEFGVNNWLALGAHNTLGVTASRENNFNAAKSEYLKCLHGYESRTNPTQIDQSWIETSNFNVAAASIGLGQFKEAEVRLNKCDSVRKRYSITTNNSYAVKLLKTRANIAEAKKDFQKAEEHWNQLLSKLLDYTNNNFYFMSDEEKAQFWKDQGNTFRHFQSFAVRRSKQNPMILGTMYNVQLATKAILLSSSNKIRKRIFSGNDTAMVNMYYRWQQRRDRLAQLYSTPSDAPEYIASVDSLKNKINHIEKELNIAAEDLEEDKGGKLVDWKEVQRALKPNEAAVEIIRYKNYDRFERDSIIYAALILTAETKTAPELVILPNGKMLEGRALKFYKNAIASQIEDKSSYNFYWADIGQKLKNKTRLYLSLDGVYNSINLNTLRDAEGNFIVDSKNITLLANTKDLLSLKGKRRASSAGANASLVGFPTYFLGKEKIKKNLSKQRDFDFSKLSDEDRSGIAELPGTKTEIEKVNSILKTHRWRVASYTDEAATEEAVKEIRQPKLVHIATHGYFTSDESAAAANTDPMLRAGLLFTGAANFLQDKISTTADNGILTAYEAANLNLDNTDLVVLSACETGKGEVQNGEGVYGLQRAFQTAGAHAIIMSLWKVDDEATQELMTSFYENWMNGTEKAEAFRNAQLKLKNKFNHPYYWGAFVMMGN